MGHVDLVWFGLGLVVFVLFSRVPHRVRVCVCACSNICTLLMLSTLTLSIKS